MHLLKPPPTARLYVRRVGDQKEYTLPESEEVVALSNLTAKEPRAQNRGALHEAFELVFALPFDQKAVDALFSAPEPKDSAKSPAPKPGISTLKIASGITALGLGALGIAGGTMLLLKAEGELDVGVSQKEARERNDRARNDRTGAAFALASGGAFIVTGALIFLLPEGAKKHIRQTGSPNSAGTAYVMEF